MKTRQEHLEFCKQRARVYLDQGDVANAITSMLSDLDKYEETQIAADGALTRVALLYAMNNDLDGAKRFVEGFN